MAILETKNLKKHFQGVKAVDGASLTFAPGKVTSIIGPNGSGKTSFMNAISGIYQMDSGVVIMNDVKLEKILPKDIMTYGMTRTFQHVRLFEQMTVLDNILVVLTKRDVLGSLFENHGDYHLKQAEKVLRRVDLWGKRNDLASNLSYGQRKLLEVARTLAMKADIYLFDEPFAGLFPEMKKLLVQIIKVLREEEKTIALITHSMDLIRELSDHVYVMDAGKLLAEGSAQEVLERKDVIEAYLGQ